MSPRNFWPFFGWNLLLTTIFLPVAAIGQVPRTIAEIRETTLTTPHRVERVGKNLRVPWELAFLPNGRMVFTERTGRVRLIENGRVVPEPALTLDVAQGNKMGLLGLATDPDFPANSFLYLAYNYVVPTKEDDDRPPFRLRVVRYRLDGNKLVEPKTLIEDIPASVNHTGCRLVFGPHNGKLYLTTGDADRPLNAQKLDQLNGKILRLNPDGSIPDDNPFVKTPGARKEIWSYGHRNPQGLAFEPKTYRLLDTEHGPNGGDEINWVERGENLGWPVIDHARTHSGMIPPVYDFSPAVAPGEAQFYAGKAFPELSGKVLVACLRGEEVLAIDNAAGKLGEVRALFRGRFGRIRSVVVSPEGYLYLTTSQFDPAEGRPRLDYDLILRVVPAGVPALGAVVKDAVPAPAPPAANASALPEPIQMNCTACHGPNLRGGMAPGILPLRAELKRDADALRKIIVNGVMEKGMPPSANLTTADVDAIVSYLQTHSGPP